MSGTSTPASVPSNHERREVQAISGHLPAGYTAEFDGTPGTSSGPSTSAPDLSQPALEESSLKLQGGDIHRDLYRIDARPSGHKRTATFHGIVPDDDSDEILSVREQLAPGGFRRAFLQQRHGPEFLAARMPVTRNFVEFLDLYGSFADEDLADSDEEAIEDEEEAENQSPETRPLLPRRQSSRVPRSADAGVVKTFFTLLKAFVGTGIMFLPKAFNNGGILFSSLTLLGISALSMLAFHLLLECKKKHGGSYGDIGFEIAGPKMRGLILGSVTLSQLGFVCSGIVFAAENLLSFFAAVSGGKSPFSTTTLVLAQLVILIPLSFIRNISKLGPAALLADVFILVGLAYIYWYDIGTIADQGIHPTVVLFNPQHYTLTIGAAIFTFEGIGLILPIRSSMKSPEHFEPLLGVVMIIITIVYTSVGALCYATFGIYTNIEVIDNYPQNNKLVNAVQLLYSIAVLAGDPVQLFPALRILEGRIFGRRSGRKSLKTKWIKNAFRTALVLLCGAVSILGAGNLDRFVALIGSFACVPLVYIYPPYLHYKGVATTKWAKIGDVALIVLGLVGMVYTTAVTTRMVPPVLIPETLQNRLSRLRDSGSTQFTTRALRIEAFVNEPQPEVNPRLAVDIICSLNEPGIFAWQMRQVVIFLTDSCNDCTLLQLIHRKDIVPMPQAMNRAWADYVTSHPNLADETMDRKQIHRMIDTFRELRSPVPSGLLPLLIESYLDHASRQNRGGPGFELTNHRARVIAAEQFHDLLCEWRPHVDLMRLHQADPTRDMSLGDVIRKLELLSTKILHRKELMVERLRFWYRRAAPSDSQLGSPFTSRSIVNALFGLWTHGQLDAGQLQSQIYLQLSQMADDYNRIAGLLGRLREHLATVEVAPSGLHENASSVACLYHCM
ncbi:hypothetical protein GQ53DRAFT_826827 [Thozetella sp. PMI_491]|nr:hypothetical protein GQ53DRAFT_826827 [Thozetella sp. PMI_491]